MPVFEVEFEVYCSKCGAGLCNQTKTENASYSYSGTRMARLEVEPCENCLKEAKDEGYEEGKEADDAG
jgi:hypothetical protein